MHNLQEREHEVESSQPLCWSKMSIHCFEDHYSRDPVQVQSLRTRQGLRYREAKITTRAPGCRAVRKRPFKALRTGGAHETQASREHWGTRPRKNSEIHIDVSHSRQPLVKGERLVRYEVNTVMPGLTRGRRAPTFEPNDEGPWPGRGTMRRPLERTCKRKPPCTDRRAADAHGKARRNATSASWPSELQPDDARWGALENTY